jgi:small-conductance mechanosensitive channel
MFEAIQAWLQPYIELIWPYFHDLGEAVSDYTYLQAAFLAALGYIGGRFLGRYLPELLHTAFGHIHLRMSEDVIALTRFPLFNLTFMSSLLLAIHISDLNPAVAFALKSILKSTMIAIVGFFIYRLGKLLLEHIAHHRDKRGIIQPQTLPLFTNTIMVFTLVGASHQIFSVWNVDMTALLASAGIAGLAIGMASKDMLADIIAGILILTDSPYRLHDVILVNDRGIKGKVTRIGMRSTRILTGDNMEIIIPNAIMGNSRIMNETSSPEPGFRMNLEVSTASGINSETIRTLLLDMASQQLDILQDRPKVVQLISFDQHIATFKLLCWVEHTDKQAAVRAALRETIYQRLVQEGIPLGHAVQKIAITHLPDSRQEIKIKEMPDSSRTIYVKEVPNLFGSSPPKKPEKTVEKVSA